jgi:hypothetical protein
MALGDVIGKPLVNPLENLAGGVQAGFEIAQNQERLRIANEQLALQKERVASDYLQKGINALGAFSKAKGKSRSIMANLITSYLDRGGVKIDPNTAALLFSDEANTDLLATALEAEKQGGPLAQKAYLISKLGVDAEELPTMLKQIEIDSQARAEIGKAVQLESVKAGFRAGEAQVKATQEADKQILELAKIPRSPKIAEFAAKLPREQQAGYLAAYDTGAGLRVNSLRDALSFKTGPSAPGLGPKRARALSLLNQIDDAWVSGDRQKADSLLNEAEVLAGDVRAAQKPANQQISAGQQASLDMQFSRIVQDRTDKVTKGVSEALGTFETLKGVLDKPGGADLGEVYAIVGQIAKSISAEGGVKTEGDIARALGSSLNLDIKKLLRYVKGEDVKLPYGEQAKLSNLVNIFENTLKNQVKSRLDKTYKNLEIDPIVTGSPQRAQFVSQHKKNNYDSFGLTFEQESKMSKQQKTTADTGFRPTPSGKPRPDEVLLEKAKKEFPNDWKRRLELRGFDVGGL